MPLPLDVRRRQNVPSFQIWAAIGYNWRSPIVFFPKCEDDDKKRGWRLNSQRYISRCLRNKEVLAKLKRKGIKFLQDGARCHTSKLSLAFLKRNGIDVIDNYPASSPDCNPIEALWVVLNAGIARRMPTTVEELKKATLEAWREIPQSVINRYVMGFQKHLKTVVRRKGL